MTAMIQIHVDGAPVIHSLTEDEQNGIEYLGTRVDDAGVVLEGIGEIAEEFVIVNYGEYDEAGYLIVPDTLTERKRNASIRQAVTNAFIAIVNDFREARSGSVDRIPIPGEPICL